MDFEPWGKYYLKWSEYLFPNNKEQNEQREQRERFLPRAEFQADHEESDKAKKIPKVMTIDLESNKGEEKKNNPNTIFPCTFCRKNGEQKKFYSSHSLKNNTGLVTCPILKKYVCPKCKATGVNAHTLFYCPQKENYQSTAVVHTTPRMGSGKKRNTFST